MRTIITRIILLVLTLGSLWAKEAEPRRESGLFVHLVPRQLAELKKSQPPATGFVISLPGETRTVNGRPAANTADELVAFLRRQPSETQRNGIWLVLAYSKAYTPVEKAHVVELKEACQRERIPLFIARDQELPKGWKRFSRAQRGEMGRDAELG